MTALGFVVVIGLPLGVLLWAVFWPQPGRSRNETETEENLPSPAARAVTSPPPAELAEALRALKTVQREECLALGVPWSDDRLITVDEAGTPLRPERYSDEFQKIAKGAGLRRIQLKGLRDTSVSLMLTLGIPVHIVAAWHGHDPSMSLSVYSETHAEDSKAAGQRASAESGGFPCALTHSWHTETLKALPGESERASDLEPPRRIELLTFSLRVKRSTD